LILSVHHRQFSSKILSRQNQRIFKLQDRIVIMRKKTHSLGRLGENEEFVGEGLELGIFSPEMLKETGCKWVILGHSERRTLFHEDDEVERIRRLLIIIPFALVFEEENRLCIT
jgi:hypothetical protein